MNGEKLGHILIIEDNRDTQTLLKYLLGADYDLQIVGEFNQAIEVANEASFDLLLIDINLGEERTGVDLLNILRETDPYNDVPMIAIRISYGFSVGFKIKSRTSPAASGDRPATTFKFCLPISNWS